MWGALAAAGAALGGSIFSALSAHSAQKNANAANIKMAREQMEFQERMSGSAHQREVSDLTAAGLNPLLSANTGASSPSGAMGSSDPASINLDPAVSSAMDSMRLYNDYETMKANTKKVGAEGDLAVMQRDFAAKNPDAYFTSKMGVGETFSARILSTLMSSIKSDTSVGPRKKPDWAKERSLKLKSSVPWYERGLGGFKDD